MCDHDLREEIRKLVISFLLSIIIFTMMKLLAILPVTANKVMIKEPQVQGSQKEVKLHIVPPFLQYNENKILTLSCRTGSFL